ncbi:hypothetical protein J14TS5_03620 [Paenibacillus lautus]|uniref:hypothetical protein n=1 Tax=Paenibacillus lautus TaxID=1401 RepID=UPI001B18B1B6|nr:hypothetical protein [Paenibacillus lautus]GIO95276.1 hypothetical protein J14TS5_03620 [Paenibacillus lautus]
MELSYFFYTYFKTREETEDFLLEQIKSIIDDHFTLRVSRQEESEEGEGDTLDFTCNYFGVNTNLRLVQETCEEFSLNLNFGLRIIIYPSGETKFIEFMGNLLKATNGNAILLDENYNKVLERRHRILSVNNYFFKGDFSKLGVPYLDGTYQRFLLQIDIDIKNESIIQIIKPKVVEIANRYIADGEGNVVEDPDFQSHFSYVSDDFRVEVGKGRESNVAVGQIVNMSVGDIYFPEDDRVVGVMQFFKKVIESFKGDCKLSVTKGYLTEDYKKIVLMKREKEVITLNESAEETTILKTVGLG